MPPELLLNGQMSKKVDVYRWVGAFFGEVSVVCVVPKDMPLHLTILSITHVKSSLWDTTLQPQHGVNYRELDVSLLVSAAVVAAVAAAVFSLTAGVCWFGRCTAAAGPMQACHTAR
jgi:hypothetical protein